MQHVVREVNMGYAIHRVIKLAKNLRVLTAGGLGRGRII